jgi:hypothetical protein
MREAVYQKNRDLLLKLAPSKYFGDAIDQNKVLDKWWSKQAYYLVWDLKKDLQNENFPF